MADLLNVVPRDGVVVNADVIGTVADVPPVGINLRVAVAGVTTTTEHGLLDDRRRVTENAPATPPDGTDAQGTVRPAESHEGAKRTRTDTPLCPPTVPLQA